ncbi:MAG: CopG family transcriptional regulator [Gemmatimonadota bacterium]|nr:CopG family transcriptional regulator [Gemmatimonadota bacterium]MDH5199032.1 CopG family transcriptional regulator [Gemmatimonadota bacterium]
MVHLRENGFTVVTRDVDDATLIEMKAASQVPRALEGCHTAVVGKYVVEGHVPAADIERLLDEQPAVLGVAVPGMPVGSPGMEMGDQREAYAVLTFDRAGKTTVFARH